MLKFQIVVEMTTKQIIKVEMKKKLEQIKKLETITIITIKVKNEIN
jgi:hypothetical protein